MRYFAVRIGDCVEIRAASAPPKGIHSKLKRTITRVIRKGQYLDNVNWVQAKKDTEVVENLVLEQTHWKGGKVLGLCPLEKFQDIHGYGGFGDGAMVEVTRATRLRVLR